MQAIQQNSYVRFEKVKFVDLKISFVLATFNCEKQAESLRKFADELKGIDYEICVADGGSSDGTLEVLAGITNLKLVCSGKDLGIYDAWNKALAAVTGEYIAFVGADDVPGSSFFNSVISTLRSTNKPLPQLIYGNAQLSRKEQVRSWISPNVPGILKDGGWWDIDFPHPGALHHKSLFEKHRFNPNYKLAGDLEFYVRLRLAGRLNSFLRIPEVQARIGADGASRSAGASKLYRLEYKKIADEHNIRMPLFSLKKRLIECLEDFPFIFEAIKNMSWKLRRVK